MDQIYKHVSNALYILLILCLLFIIAFLSTLIVIHKRKNRAVKNDVEKASEKSDVDVEPIKNTQTCSYAEDNISKECINEYGDVPTDNKLITPLNDESKCKLWINKTKNFSINEAHEYFIKEGKKINEKDEDFPVFPRYWLSPNKDREYYQSLKDNGKWLHEEYCRDFMEYIFSKKFISIFPTWCRNPKSGRKLQLDVYNEELQIAVEYNGIQHYEFTPRFQKDINCLYEQQYRDSIKKKLCSDNEVFLITVPHTIVLEKIPIFIYSCLLEAYKDD